MVLNRQTCGDLLINQSSLMPFQPANITKAFEILLFLKQATTTHIVDPT